MKNKFKLWLQKYLPDLYYFITSYRFASRSKKRFYKFQTELASAIYPDNKITVLSGPFKDVKYYNKVVWGPITPKWLGSYEEELHEITDLIISKKYKTIIDVGAAEGYYAVGLSKKCPESAVYSFDVDPIARKRQASLSELNNISNLNIGRYCSHNTLTETITEQTLIICDIEGAEFELLDPSRVAKLREVDILVELHPCGTNTEYAVKSEIEQRFRKTHEVKCFTVTKRDAAYYRDSLANLKDVDLSLIEEALKEYRFETQCWLWLEVK